jgi:hypothetical protein
MLARALPAKGSGRVPYYYFEAATADGGIRKKVLKARDKKDADTKIRDFGLRPMRIENYQAVKKKKLKALHTRHIVRDTLSAVAGISLVGGIAAYFIVLDITSPEGLDFQSLTRSGIVSETPGIINTKTQEERIFAVEAREALKTMRANAFGGITIDRKFLMIIYIKNLEEFTDEDLEAVARIMTAGFQRRFKTPSCMVLLVHKGKEIATGQYIDGKIKTKVY